jgi:hypothetical protein
MRAKNGSAGWRIAKIAGSQHGNITRAQLLEIDVSPAGVGRRVANGVLLREFHAVYRVGHRAPNVLARYCAAVLACGEGAAALCGPAAAFAYGLLRGQPPAPEVIVAGHRKVRGVIVHRARSLDPADVRIWQGIPTTTVPRTLIDLAGILSLDVLARVHHEARIRFHVQPEAVDDVLQRRRNSTGIAGLRAVVHGDTPLLLSRLERSFVRFLRVHAFPLPITNRPEGAHYVDCRWPQYRLTVELDSFRFHNSRLVWEQDRQRDREAHDRGDKLRRFTWRDVFEDQQHMLRQVDRLVPRR